MFSEILPLQQPSWDPAWDPVASCWWHWRSLKCHSRRRYNFPSQAATFALKVRVPCNVHQPFISVICNLIEGFHKVQITLWQSFRSISSTWPSSDRHLIMLLSVLLSLLFSSTKLPLSSQSLLVKLHLFLHHHLTPSVTIQLCNSSNQSLHLKSSKFFPPSRQRRLFLTC